MPLPLAPRRLLALALAVAGCWAGAASAAPLRVETRLSDAFSAVWERETVDGFSYTMLQAEADLSAASLEIQAAMVGKALLEADALERVAGFRDAFLVAGTDGFTSAR